MSVLKRQKGLCDVVAYEHPKTQLCCHDADEFDWERDRIQTLFLKQLHMFSGGRPGAFVPTNYYPDINLSYSDVDFLLVRDGTGVERYAISLVQNWMKGERYLKPSQRTFVLSR